MLSGMLIFREDQSRIHGKVVSRTVTSLDYWVTQILDEDAAEGLRLATSSNRRPESSRAYHNLTSGRVPAYAPV